MSFIITEFEVLNSCCSSQRDKEVIKTFIGVYPDINEVRQFAIQWAEKEQYDLSIKQIRQGIKKGILRPEKSCECGKFLVFDSSEPHTCDSVEPLFSLGFDIPDEEDQSGEIYDLDEKITVGICCQTDKNYSRVIWVGIDMSITSIKRVITKRIKEYSEGTLEIGINPKDEICDLLDLIIKAGGIIKDKEGCKCKTQLVISGSKLLCPINFNTISESDIRSFL